jgi:hypothetical protein
MKRSDFFPIDAPLWSMYCRDHEYLHGKTVYLNRFIARYSLAKAFKGIDAKTYRRSTLMGYDAVMRLMLAFSAYDNLFKAIEKLTPQLSLTYDMHSFKIHNAHLEDQFRNNRTLIRLLKADARDTSLDRIEEFERGGKSITCIAFGIRNMVAHGQMNPTASKASTASVAKQINQLGFLVLDACDFIFRDYLNVLKQILDDPIKADYDLIVRNSKELSVKQRLQSQENNRKLKKLLQKQFNSSSHAIDVIS